MNDQPAGARRTRLTGAIVLFAAFLVGALSGAAVDRAITGRHDRGHHYVFEQLDLSAQQHARIDSVLKARRQQVSAFWDSAGPRWQAIVDSTRSGIRAALTPDQLKEYDRLLAARRAAIKKRNAERSQRKDSTASRHD